MIKLKKKKHSNLQNYFLERDRESRLEFEFPHFKFDNSEPLFVALSQHVKTVFVLANLKSISVHY